MILFPCLSCGLVIRVMGDPDQVSLLVGQSSDFFPDKYTCPACTTPVKLVPEVEMSISAIVQVRLRDLTAEEFFQAQMGLGLPEERVCSRGVIDKLFEQPIKKVHGKEVPGSGRFQVDSIEFQDGTFAFLGASGLGALIYRIRLPFSQVEHVSHD